MSSIMEELKNIKALRADIESLRTRRARLRASMEGLSPRPREGSRGTATRDRMATALAQLEELDIQILELMVEAESRALELEQTVDLLPGMQRQVMRLRYLEGLPWSAVSLQLGYSIDHCYTLHRVAKTQVAEKSSF